MKFSFAYPAAFAAMLVGASFVSAEDSAERPASPVVVVKPRTLVFNDGVSRFHVERDVTTRRMTFRLADPAVRIDGAPVVVMTTDAGPKEFTLVAAEGQPGTWVWADDAVKAERFDGTMRVLVGGKPYTAQLATVWTAEALRAARYGGRLLALPDCGASVEVVQDLTTGTLTIYSFEDVVVTEAPVVTITQTAGPAKVTMTQVAGKPGVWVTKHDTLRTTRTAATIRLLVNGKPCEAPLVYVSGRGGRVLSVDGGPNFEVVRDPKHGHYTFYALDETYDGKVYTVENPSVVINGHRHDLTRVEGEPRAWRMVGLDTAGSNPTDGQLNFTLFGKTLSTRVGFSGLGIDLR